MTLNISFVIFKEKKNKIILFENFNSKSKLIRYVDVGYFLSAIYLYYFLLIPIKFSFKIDREARKENRKKHKMEE